MQVRELQRQEEREGGKEAGGQKGRGRKCLLFIMLVYAPHSTILHSWLECRAVPRQSQKLEASSGSPTWPFSVFFPKLRRCLILSGAAGT